MSVAIVVALMAVLSGGSLAAGSVEQRSGRA